MVNNNLKTGMIYKILEKRNDGIEYSLIKDDPNNHRIGFRKGGRTIYAIDIEPHYTSDYVVKYIRAYLFIIDKCGGHVDGFLQENQQFNNLTPNQKFTMDRFLNMKL